jgi:hypothetical protein
MASHHIYGLLVPVAYPDICGAPDYVVSRQ